MKTYIALVKLTSTGLKNIKNQPEILAKIKKDYEAAGCKLVANYLTMGQYDLVTISEAPDDETIARLFLHFAEFGTIQTETLRAFPEEEYLTIIEDLP